MIQAVSEDAVLVTLADTISEQNPQRIGRLLERIRHQNYPWLVDLVPSYTTLLVIYDPLVVSFREVIGALRSLLSKRLDASAVLEPSPPAGEIVLPVYYGPETGPDLRYLAERAGISEQEVIRRHTAPAYLVFAIGFAPGFAFLGEVDSVIACPRKDRPRTRVPAGSVGIANRQTAVYPWESPGGWQLIGRCPTTLFDMDNLSLLRVGQRVRFRAISREEYLGCGGRL